MANSQDKANSVDGVLVERAVFVKRLRIAQVGLAKLKLDLAELDKRLARAGYRTNLQTCW